LGDSIHPGMYLLAHSVNSRTFDYLCFNLCVEYMFVQLVERGNSNKM
jgi:hypothetical protein